MTSNNEQYPLARIGGGRKTHVLDPNGRVRCENSGTWTYLTQDPDGRYSDKTLTSTVRPLGSTGRPSCYWCQKVLE